VGWGPFRIASMLGRAGTGWLCSVLLVLLVVPSVAPAQGLDYEVEIRGLDEHHRLLGIVEIVSRLVTLRERSPATVGVLRRRIAGDVDRFESVLRSEGYYDGIVEGHLDSNSEPLAVVMTVDAGPPYLFGGLSARLVDDATATAKAQAIADGYMLGMGDSERAKGAKILAAEERLLDRFANAGYPFVRTAERRVTVDHATRSVDVELLIDPGPRARLGNVLLTGLDEVSQDFVRGRLRWVVGDLYSPALLEETRRRLVDTRLFSSVSVRTGEQVDDDGRVPVVVSLHEAPPRTIGAGLRYSSSEGIGGNAFWEHRNLFHAGEKLRVDGRKNDLELLVNVGFRKPDFYVGDQTLVLNTSYGTEDNSAFQTKKVAASVSLERNVGRLWAGRAGVSFEYGPVESEAVADGERLQDEKFRLIGIPMKLSRDTSDNVLNPSSGSRFAVEATPYLEQLGSDRGFLLLQVSDSLYLPLGPRHKLVAAGRVLVGSILAARDHSIPSDKRFFSGGGGSVRGYDYQLAGPLDQDNTPLGGRSVIEIGGELRWRISDKFGLVPFIEGGNVFSNALPDVVDASLLWGTGLGLRYYSGVGPLRLDVATPLNGRDGIDDSYELYISLGQAF